MKSFLPRGREKNRFGITNYDDWIYFIRDYLHGALCPFRIIKEFKLLTKLFYCLLLKFKKTWSFDVRTKTDSADAW